MHKRAAHGGTVAAAIAPPVAAVTHQVPPAPACTPPLTALPHEPAFGRSVAAANPLASAASSAIGGALGAASSAPLPCATSGAASYIILAASQSDCFTTAEQKG